MTVRHRYTLRGRLGCRPDRLPARATTAIGVYVLSSVLGWIILAALAAKWLP